MTAFTPCRGKITEFDGEVGTIQTDVGPIRFGRTSCSEFVPALGMDVWLMATKTLPVLGERAALVNLSGEAEISDPEERARLKQAAAEKRLQAVHARQEAARETFLPRAMAAKLPKDWMPDPFALSEHTELPWVTNLGPDWGSPATRPFVRLGAFGRDVHDPSLVPFAHIPGDEPDFLALFYSPDLAERGRLPVVYWRHDDELLFVADDMGSFLESLAHGKFVLDGVRMSRLQTLADRRKLLEPSDDMLAREIPDEYEEAFFGRADQRDLVGEYVAAAEQADLEVFYAASEELEASYKERGWTYHVYALRYQRRAYFAV